MELKDFIEETLVNITTGIRNAQEKAHPTGAVINPNSLRYNTGSLREQGYTSDGRVTSAIDFDLAVTITEGSSVKAKIGVISGLLNLGTQGAIDTSNIVVSRIRFSIPILYPYEDLPTPAALPRRTS
jgi:hypothetical protein